MDAAAGDVLDMTQPRFAFFDVDCLEVAPDNRLRLHPNRRLRPYRKKLCSLYRLIGEGGYPLVFTTCYSRPMLQPGDREDILFVPLDSSDTGWKSLLPTRSLIYLHKTYRDPTSVCRNYDMFADNGNAAALVRELAAGEWIVFGNGFDLCTGAAIEGILRADARVSFISDCMTPVVDPQPVFARWRNAGAEELTMSALVHKLENAR
jgi:hypothetical protein